MDEFSDVKNCPYCKDKSVYVDSSEVYPRSYGMIYLCRPCHAWVGVHKGTNVALGRIANSELRNFKKQAHYYFDILWKRKINKGLTKKIARTKAYMWLSRELKIPAKKTHIGMFDVDQCRRVVELCLPYFKTISKKEKI
jgi:hypothetical protein